MKLTKRQKQIISLIMAIIVTMIYVPDILDTNKIHISDGDTFKIGDQKYRLFGIDAFELSQTCTNETGQEYSCGEKSKQALKKILSTSEKLECVEKDIDRYKRIVAICRINDVDIGRELVSQGWALDYNKYSNGRYLNAEIYAMENKRGVWAGDFTKPEKYRKEKN